MDDPFRPGGAAPAEEVTDRLLDALAAGDLAAVQRLEAARPDLALSPAAAAAGAARRALAVRSDPAVRAQQVRALMDEAVRLRNAPGPASQPVPGPASQPAPRTASQPGPRAAPVPVPGAAPGPGAARQARRRQRWSWPRRVAVTLAAVIGVGAAGLTATAALAANAQPGQALYGTKLALENVEVDVQLNPTKKVSLRVRFAEERLDELSALLAQGRAGQATRAAANLATQERQIIASLIKLAAQGKAPPSLVRTLELDLARHAAKLSAERAASACGRRPLAPACRQLTTAQRTTARAILRLSQLPGGVPPRGSL